MNTGNGARKGKKTRNRFEEFGGEASWRTLG
jgi:hypothetical protein